VIINWPEGVACEKDKGVYSLGAEEADKLYHALFLVKDEQRLRFVRRGVESADNDNAAISLPTAPSDRLCTTMAGKQAKFRVTTAEGYGQHSKKRRCFD